MVLGTECRGRLSESGVITVSGGLGSLPKSRPSVDEGELETAGVVTSGGISGAYLLGFVQCRNSKAALRVRQVLFKRSSMCKLCDTTVNLLNFSPTDHGRYAHRASCASRPPIRPLSLHKSLHSRSLSCIPQ